LPAGSIARTVNEWLPSGRAVYSFDEEQVSNAPASSLHSNVEPVSEEENSKVALVELESAGAPESIVVWGSVVSTVQVRLAPVGSWFPAGSVALTVNVCEPSGRPV
jgi:hypothetical protein